LPSSRTTARKYSLAGMLQCSRSTSSILCRRLAWKFFCMMYGKDFGVKSTYGRRPPNDEAIMIPCLAGHRVGTKAVPLPSRQAVPLIVVHHDQQLWRRVRYAIERTRSQIRARCLGMGKDELSTGPLLDGRRSIYALEKRWAETHSKTHATGMN
jgi:hypothetical protein